VLFTGFVHQATDRTTGWVVDAGDTTGTDRYVLGSEGICDTDANKNGRHQYCCKSLHKHSPLVAGKLKPGRLLAKRPITMRIANDHAPKELTNITRYMLIVNQMFCTF
jgi:hypothetical protein